MKNWLIEKELEQKNLFQELVGKSVETLKDFNIQENKELSVRVVFSKDEWLDGYANIEFLQKNSDDEYDVKSSCRHSVYNTNKDISSNSTLCKLMAKGLFTNTWFALLDAARTYDATFIISDKECIMENDDCEYRENRMKQTHTGFNILSPQEKKNKIR